MASRPHTETCRQRMEHILKQEGDPRWTRAKERADERVWEEIQRQAAQEEAQKVASQEEEERKDRKRQQQQQPEGEAASSSSNNKQQQQEAQEAENAKRSKPASSGDLADARDKRKPQEDKTEGQEHVDKRPKAQETQGVKRDSPDPGDNEDRHHPRRRTNADPMNTDVTHALLHVDVAEAYSPPRVTEHAKKYGLVAGEAMDLTTGWDFSKECNRQRAREYLETQKPRLLIGSPMCTMFSQLQKLTAWNEPKEASWGGGRETHRVRCEIVSAADG